MNYKILACLGALTMVSSLSANNELLTAAWNIANRSILTAAWNMANCLINESCIKETERDETYAEMQRIMRPSPGRSDYLSPEVQSFIVQAQVILARPAADIYVAWSLWDKLKNLIKKFDEKNLSLHRVAGMMQIASMK